MPAITLRESLWKDFVALAQKKQKKPEALAEMVLRDYLTRVAEEDLLAQSERAVRRTRFPIRETEHLIKQYRRRKAKS